MKLIKHISFALVLALTTILTSCSSSDDNGGGSSLPTHIEAKVDGVQFNTNIAEAGIATRAGSGDSSVIQIVCADATTLTQENVKSISVILIGVSTPGTYAVNESTNSTLGYVESNPTNHSWDTGDCVGATGTITVTSISETGIEGTFSFTGANDENCSDVKQVTEGHFHGTF
jgi:hypothetical protein